jgi:hypothetical protein
MSDPYGQPVDPYGPSPWSPPGPERRPGHQQPGYQQPGYQQPTYEQPTYERREYERREYDRPGYERPGYDRPAYQPTSGGGYQGGGYQGGSGYPSGPAAEPGWPQQYPGRSGTASPAPPPRRRSSAPIIIGAIVVAVLLIVGVVAVVNLVGNTGPTSPTAARSGSAGPTSTATGGPAATTAAPTRAATLTLTPPDRIGTYRKKADQSEASSARGDAQGSGLEQPFAVVYEDTAAKGHELLLWGGTSARELGDSQAALDTFFSSAGKDFGNGTSLGSRTAANPGSVGGKAECAKVNGLPISTAICAWVGSNALVVFGFLGVSADKAGGQVRTILAAVVKS